MFMLALGLFNCTAFAQYIYPCSHLGGLSFFALAEIFVVVGTAHHVKYGLAELVFVKDPANEKSLGLMMELLDAAPATRLCYVACIGMVVALIATVVIGVTPLPRGWSSSPSRQGADSCGIRANQGLIGDFGSD